jgi:hypothetical protein
MKEIIEKAKEKEGKTEKKERKMEELKKRSK